MYVLYLYYAWEKLPHLGGNWCESGTIFGLILFIRTVQHSELRTFHRFYKQNCSKESCKCKMCKVFVVKTCKNTQSIVTILFSNTFHVQDISVTCDINMDGMDFLF